MTFGAQSVPKNSTTWRLVAVPTLARQVTALSVTLKALVPVVSSFPFLMDMKATQSCQLSHMQASPEGTDEMGSGSPPPVKGLAGRWVFFILPNTLNHEMLSYCPTPLSLQVQHGIIPLALRVSQPKILKNLAQGRNKAELQRSCMVSTRDMMKRQRIGFHVTLK